MLQWGAGATGLLTSGVATWLAVPPANRRAPMTARLPLVLRLAKAKDGIEDERQ
jgi:hypothetical protein